MSENNVPDIEFIGDGNLFQLLCKASSQSEGWTKSVKAMETHNGCIVQVSTQQRSNGGFVVAEALVFVPNVRIDDDINNGRKLVWR